MVKYYATLTLILVTFVTYAQSLNLNEIRKDFNKGVKNEKLCQEHLDKLEKLAKSPLEKGYEAAFHMFMAKHTSNPFKKMNYFKGGKKLLEEQIKQEPKNTELRFIRLCIQYYIPSYLGYKSNIDEDKEYLVANLYKLKDQQAKDLIFDYLKGAKMYSDKELALLGR